MDAQTTSRAEVASPGPAIWLELARFVRRPRLPVRRVPFGWAAIGEIGWLLLLDVLVALPLAAVLTALAKRTGLTTPQFEVLTEQGPEVTLLVGALVLPIFEEILFRGWLSGRKRHLALTGVVLAAIGSLYIAERFLAGMALGGAVIGALLFWIVAGWWLVKRAGSGIPTWFEGAFPWLYLGTSLAFALAHMSNYDQSRPWLLLPFVIPQGVAGLIFGFARVRHGMWANIALHAAGNALFLSLALGGF